MSRKLQFAGWLMGLAMSAALAVPAFAQGPRANWAQNRQDNKPPKQQQRQEQRQQQRQEQRRENRQPRQETGRAQNQRQNSGANRPPNSNPNRADMMARPNNNPNRPPSAYTPPPPKQFNTLPRQEQQKILQNNKSFEKLPPAQKQQMREAAANWSRLTPEQRNHIQSNVLPQWKQLPPNRQRAIQQRLGVLQNMPESARNQHLNDPNFTRGMSEEDKAMLRDLSHLHVGAPDPPNE
jgi:Protein of unknown function (DUF3106)